ncbi:MAG: hypothetical protein KGH57_01125 [Candidatus Micrarchaeota archaeon]|nr:hypothetical protein [Candidatus Micrarchaeota archaeon]
MAMQKRQFRLPAWRLSLRQIIGLVAALIVIYIAYGILLPSVVTITSTRSLTLSTNQSQLIKIYNGSPADMKVVSSSSSSASFYLTSVPVLYGPVVSFSLSPQASLNVSSSGSGTADMNIKLVSSSNSSITVEITPLTAALGIKPSRGVTLLNPASLSNIGTSNITITTLSTVSTTSTTTTTISTNSTLVLFQQALTLMNKTGTGVLMKNYAALYAKDVACTPSVYNATYTQYYSKHPPAPVDYYNVSLATPTGIKINESKLSKTNVLLTYSTVSPSPGTTGTAVQAIINTSSSSFIQSLSFTGVYAGFNYTILNKSYAFQSKILNNCGAYISPP